MMTRRKALAALAAGVLVTSLAGATANASHAQPARAARADTLTVGSIAAPLTMAVSGSEYGNRVLFYQAVYDGLLRAKPDGTLEPWLATEWKYNDDKTVLTLTLKEGIKFTDGTAFDSAAVVANLTAFKAGKSPDASNLAHLKEAKAVDAKTVEITLDGPDPAFLNYLGRNAGLMESPKMIGSADEAATPVGTGPYTLDAGKTVADSVYTYKANPDYWNPDMIKYDNLVIKVIADPAAMVNAIKAGELNAANLLNNDVVADVESAGWTINKSELDWVGLTLVDRDGKMNTPLKDLKVRQALNYAFDRAAILKGYGAGFGTVTNQVFPAASPGFDAALDSTYTYDPAKAKSMLAEAGYPNGFELSMPSVSALGEAVFAIIADQLSAIGVKVNYTEVPINDFFTDILTPKYPAYLMFLEQSPNDWQFINFLIAPTAVWNPSHYTDATSKDLIDKIEVASDADRPALVKQLGKYVTEQAWFVPWYRKQNSFATDAKTTIEMQSGNAVPYLFSFVPKA